ncbi:unnamed protein product [Peronospora effusa]|nr:unnamed protein product [Peronospora effusa]
MYMPFIITLLIVTIVIVYADNNSFSPVDEAIWLDRLNYFRTTGLPWSAANMQRMGWKNDLAKTAASSAAKCSATTGPGVNVYQSSSLSSTSLSIIDEAIQEWVVETSMKTLRTLAQPGALGVEIGKGTYNAYSQILWASTTSVGCALASCSGGKMVVCEFSPPGNDGSSAWYVHAEPASKCPSGTTASQGLCGEKEDTANKQIALIPAGKLTYEVYPAYVANMQTVLVEAARGFANGEKPPTAPSAATTATPTSSSLKTPLKTPSVSFNEDGDTKASATDETPSSSKTPSVSSIKDNGDIVTEKALSSLKTPLVSSNEDVDDTKKSATEKTPSSSKTHSVSSDEDVGDTKASDTEKTSSSSKTHSVSLDEDVGDTKKSATEKTSSSSKTPSVRSDEDVGDTKKSATEKTSSSSKTHSVRSDEDVGDTKTSDKEKTLSSSKTPSDSSDEDVGDTKKSATEKTPSSSKTHSVSSDEDVGDTKTSAMDETPSPSTKTGKESTSTSKKPDKTSTHSSMETSTEQEEDLVPGTVKASSDKGSTFTNEKPSTKNPTSSSPTSTSSKPDNDESLSPTTPMSGSSPAPSTMTATQHKGVESNISVAGITGISVLVIVCIAAFGVVMSYKRNQRRQREIMRDGGIRVD